MKVPGSEDDLHRVRAGELPARTVRAALGGQRGGWDVARQASLQPDQPLDVGAQHELLQVALDQHRDRLFAEAAVEASGWPCTASWSSRRSVLVAAVGCSRSASAAGAEREHDRHAITSRGRRAAPPASAARKPDALTA